MASRIDRLARPKPSLLQFPDRRSVYWLDELPAEKTILTTAFAGSPRVERLSKRPAQFCQDSRVPEWPVSAAALKACASQRVCSLALPRLPAEGWRPDRPLLATLSVAVKTTKTSQRVCQLAQPKRINNLNCVSEESRAHMVTIFTATPSTRTQQLASPKQLHSQHTLARPVSWPVPNQVLKAAASERLKVLAVPKTRLALFEGNDPYQVSPAARVATASPRLLQLSVPLARKCKEQ